MEYNVVRKGKLKEIVTAVRELIEKGWIPQGGISFFQEYQNPEWKGDPNRYYVQAMIREQNPVIKEDIPRERSIMKVDPDILK